MRSIRQVKRVRGKSVRHSEVSAFTIILELVCNTLYISHARSIGHSSLFTIPVTPNFLYNRKRTD